MRFTLLLAALAATAGLVLAVPASGDIISGFTEAVSPPDETNATEPSDVVDRSDGTIYVAWQATGSHVARSDDGGRTFQLKPEFDPFGRDLGDVDIDLGGPTPCPAPVAPTTITIGTTTAKTGGCVPGAHRVYVTSLERLPLVLQVKLAYSDDRGESWTINDVAAVNPSFIDRPWMAVYPSKASADRDQVYIAYHDFTASQIWVSTSNNGGQTFGPQVDVLAQNALAFANSFCNTVPSDIEVDPETGDVYVEWITADPVQNTSGGCNITQLQNFHQVWVAHSPPGGLLWDAHLVYDGGPATNTDEIFTTLAVDDSGTQGTPGNVYAVYPDNLQNEFDIWFSRSFDKAQRWDGPYKVNSDKGTHFFPWIAAGSTGRVDFIWLNTPDVTPSDPEESPWWAYFAQTRNAADPTTAPRFQQTSASSSVMHVGGICTNGIFCTVNSGNRDLADSISIAIDKGGSAALVWTDQGRILHGPTHIEYGCVTSQQTAYVGAKQGDSCKGPAGP